MGTALELEAVFQHVGPHCALTDISLRMEQGEWLLLIGPNGAGKTLLTRLILGIDTPSAGTIRVFGKALATLNDRAMRRLRRDLGAVLQGGSLLEDLTVLENLLIPLRAAPLGRNEMARAARLVMTQLQLDGLENHPPRSLSLGQRRRVELGRALIHKPALLVWDGLTDGLDPASARETLNLLRDQQEHQNLTLLATDNRPDVLAQSGDRVAVLDRGRLVFDGSRARLEQTAEERLELRFVLRGRP
ncbi:MAG: ABC transporter ATP-binding protein [Pseudomonadota bacterium]|nr:ABC transporter ATP-binding protein [Pseudomonadota bacterium]